MVTDSEGEKSEYEEHFSQSQTKLEKARKQESRTPEAEGKEAEKSGPKKQRKQLQYPTPSEELKAEEQKGREKEKKSSAGNISLRTENHPRKAKDNTHSSGDELKTANTATPKVDKRKGKDAANHKTPGN
ncbi:unnamed protein product [Calypogeia fissa]